MHFDLSKWNPFRFFRKSPEDKHARLSEQTPRSGDLPAAAWSSSASPAIADPLRMMQEVLRDPFTGWGPLDRWFGDFSPSVFQPRIDVIDDGDALRITAELPGMDREDVEIVAEDGYLVLRGEKNLESRTEEKGCFRVERAFGSFQRAVPLPEGVDPERAEAKFDKGLLTIRLPKPEAQKSNNARRIEIK